MPHLDTVLAQCGARWDVRTGAVSMPVYHSATFRHPALGKSTGFDYSRTANPTRSVLEETMAVLDGGVRGFAFASGLAAIDTVLRLFQPGERILATEDLYGGTFRTFEKLFRPYGLETVYVNTADTAAVQTALADSRVRGVFLEVPSNPLLNVADIRAIAAAAAARGALTIVDNTFLTPARQRPLELGADLTVYSATKYLGGHDDVVAGLVVAKTAALAERLAFFQNAIGGILGPQDAWLLLRGLKTLHLRLARQEQTARRLAAWLAAHPQVKHVYYPGLAQHPGHATLAAQATGFGAMVSLELRDPQRVADILAGVEVFMFAESLGGITSLITFPAVQTHADMDPASRARLGISNGLLRLSIGVEDPDDLQADLARVLA